jgi:DNA-binding XRE family transcriptional regulator
VAKLVAAIRALEPLKGQERRRRLNDILFTNDLNQRIVKNHYLSLLRLVAEEGIDPHAVAPEIYRDEADVQHDLDLLEREGKPLNFNTLIHGHGRLYKTIRETGWGAERVESRPLPVIFPPLNPRMELLRNRMIDLRRKHHMSMATAASKAGISGECWDGIETKQVKTKETSIAKIERLLEEYQIPISTMPHTSVE